MLLRPIIALVDAILSYHAQLDTNSTVIFDKCAFMTIDFFNRPGKGRELTTKVFSKPIGIAAQGIFLLRKKAEIVYCRSTHVSAEDIV